MAQPTLEQWVPRINNPGVQQSPGGAYRNPEAVIPDWKSITAGWQNMGESLAKNVTDVEAKKNELKMAEALKEAEEEKKRQELNSQGAEKFDHGAVAGINVQNIRMVTDWYEGQLAKWKEKYGADAGYGDLNLQEQEEVRKMSEELGLAREALGTIAIEYHKNNDIDYSKLADNPKTRDFLDQLMKKEGSMKKIEKRNGVMGVVYTNKAGEEDFIELGTLVANTLVYSDATEKKNQLWDKIDKIVEPHRKDIEDIQKKVEDNLLTPAEARIEIEKITKKLQGKLIGNEITERKCYADESFTIPDENGTNCRQEGNGKWESEQGIFAGDGYGHLNRKFIHHNFLGDDKKFLKTDFNNKKTGAKEINDFNVDFMEFVMNAFNIDIDPSLFPPKTDTTPLTKEQIKEQKLLSDYNLESTDITPAVTDVMNRVLNLAGLPTEDLEITLKNLEEHKDKVFPTKLSKGTQKNVYNKMKTEWNVGGKGADDELPLSTLTQIVEYGLMNDGDFTNYTGTGENWKNNITEIYKIWKDEYKTQVVVAVAGEGDTDEEAKQKINQSTLDELLNFSGDKINGEVIITSGALAPKVEIKNGKTIVKMYYPKGGINQKTGNPRTQAEATTFDISDEEGMKNFFRAIMGHTDDPTKNTKMNNMFLYLYDEYKNKKNK